MTKKKKKPGPKRSNVDVADILKPKKRLPDLDKLSEARKLTDTRPAVRLGGQLSSVLPGAAPKTEAQKALEACGEAYETLKASDKRFEATVHTMVGLRQAYAVAYRELQDRIQRAQEDAEEVGELPPELADFTVQYAMWLAAKPFNEHDLMANVANTILPWLADTIDAHTEADAAAQMAAVAEANEKRRNTPLPIGFKHSPVDEGLSLSRDRALVLVGWRNAVQWLFDEISTRVLAAEEQFNVLRMFNRAPKPGEQHARLVRLAPTAWHAAADTDRALDTMVARYIEPTMGAPIDLLLVDDLAEANAAGFIGRSRFARAGDAHKRLKRWTEKLGAAMVATVPTDDWNPPDTTLPDFEQLRTFSHLRTITVSTGEEDGKPDQYKVVIGNNATVLFVDKTTLDAYGTSALILPSVVI